MDALTARERALITVVLVIGIAWQVYQLFWIFRFVPLIDGMVSGFAFPLPPLTKSFFATYRFWPAAPVLSVLLTADLLHRERPSALHVLAVAGFILGAGWVMSIWSLEAAFAPMFALFEKFG